MFTFVDYVCIYVRVYTHCMCIFLYCIYIYVHIYNVLCYVLIYVFMCIRAAILLEFYVKSPRILEDLNLVEKSPRNLEFFFHLFKIFCQFISS